MAQRDQQSAQASAYPSWRHCADTCRRNVATTDKQTLEQTRLFGQQWLEYLCGTYPRAQRHVLRPLAADLYRQTPELTPEQRRALLRELRRWLRHNHV